jgi:5-methylcytosine-specific restriction endonuclease McrA
MSKKRRGDTALRKEVRARVFARDRFTCVLRGVAGAGTCFGPLTPHHKLKASQGGAYSEENLVSMCSSMNDRLESDADLAARARKLGYVILRGD